LGSTQENAKIAEEYEVCVFVALAASHLSLQEGPHPSLLIFQLLRLGCLLHTNLIDSRISTRSYTLYTHPPMHPSHPSQQQVACDEAIYTVKSYIH
jgi:hypothetical protein